jgi:nitroimidazol reductase NimA-like FMN-containing flavoprotein (pyridoxamine 5'-phosphate oxidase superfamily)
MAATFGVFAREEAELAAHVRDRLHGRTAYLATVRGDGAPRVHPVTPVVADHALFLFMEPDSPKGHDLRRGSHYALHCGVEDSSGGGGEVMVAGTATTVDDPAERARAVAASSYAPAERYVLFTLEIESAVARTYRDGQPVTRRYSAR